MLITGLALIDGVFYGLYLLKAIAPPSLSFFYDPLEGYAGFLYDFFNPVMYTYHLNPMDFQWSNAPPFLHLLCFLLSFPMRLFTTAQGGADMAYSTAGKTGFCLLAAAMLAAVGFAMNRFAKPHLRRWERGLLCALVALSYPFFFALACGNLVLLAAAFIALFLVVYQQKKYALAAVLLGMAAALKLYPALLGLLFLRDKRWREALLCAGTALLLTGFSLAVFQGGFMNNLTDWLAKTASYNQYGNMDLRRILMDNNSFLMLWDIPYYMARGGAVGLEEMALHNGFASVFLLALLMLACAGCFLLRRRQDRVLLLCLWMVGYPYSSAPYNLVLLLVPLIHWASQETKRNAPMLSMACLLFMCKTRFALYATTLRQITVQSALNPLLLLAMMAWLFWMRRKELKADWRAFAQRAARLWNNRNAA